ncbi:hypothetical protein ACFV0O_11850 [Kitasatospora sp. NPDC059577]|uniref:hypothetical protein n=1 Tax=Kitasatospora sp. NPDC059577 TaxID=3346873 RepID=UPI0036B6D9AD
MPEQSDDKNREAEQNRNNGSDSGSDSDATDSGSDSADDFWRRSIAPQLRKTWVQAGVGLVVIAAAGFGAYQRYSLHDGSDRGSGSTAAPTPSGPPTAAPPVTIASTTGPTHCGDSEQGVRLPQSAVTELWSAVIKAEVRCVLREGDHLLWESRLDGVHTAGTAPHSNYYFKGDILMINPLEFQLSDADMGSTRTLQAVVVNTETFDAINRKMAEHGLVLDSEMKNLPGPVRPASNPMAITRSG